MKKHNLTMIIAGVAALASSGMAGSAGFSYSGASSSFNFSDPACTTSFAMDGNGNITCSGATTTPVAPSCSINPTNPSFAQNGAGVTLSANCLNAPTSFQWSLDGVQVSTAATYAPPVSLAVGSHAVVLAGTNSAGTGTGTATLTVTDPAVAPPPVTACPQTMTEQPMDFAAVGNTKHVKMNRGQGYAFRFTTDASGRTGSLDSAQSTIGATVYRFMNVSEQMCDFSYTNYDSANGCAASGSYSATINYQIGAGSAMVCPLKPNTTYYANVRNENATVVKLRDGTLSSTRGIDTCPAGSTCGFVFGVY